MTTLHTFTTRTPMTTARTFGLLAAAPFIGLVFVLVMPFAGLALLAGHALKAMLKDGRLLRAARNIALFFAAPFIGLGYILLMPLAGLAALAWIALRTTPTGEHTTTRAGLAPQAA
ncbi:MAG: hypothetical protein HY855_00380 [Burkholderiales bacterium]|nr:hypothetical protein [Burkholderiales bacterium]